MEHKRAGLVNQSPISVLKLPLVSMCLARLAQPSLVVVIFLHLLVSACHAEEQQPQNYKRSQVVRIAAFSDADVNFVRDLKHKFNLDTWRDLHQPNTTGDFFVPPHLYSVIRNFLRLHGIPYTILISDATRYILEHDEREARGRAKRASPSADGYRFRYLTYTQMIKYLQYLQSAATSINFHLGSIGRSAEGRDTPYVKITSKRDSRPKVAIFIDGGFHSREWISPAMALEIIHRLAFNTEQDPETDLLLDLFDFIIVPLVNPDGYDFTFDRWASRARLWRKSRADTYSLRPDCYGVDLNRNFGYMWNDSVWAGGSSDPCSSSYSGPHSFSEPESRNLRDLLLSSKDAIKGYLSFHSYGQYVLYPWGFRKNVPIEDEEELLDVAMAFKDTMMLRNYTYTVGGSANSLYPAAGGSTDYVRGTVGVKFAYTFELSPSDGQFAFQMGFLVPESEVKSIVSDTWEGIKVFLFRIHSYTIDRPEKLGTISQEMGKRLITQADDGPDSNESVSYGKDMSAAEPESKDVSLKDILNTDLQVQSVVEPEVLLEENPLDESKIKQEADQEHSVNEDSFLRASTESEHIDPGSMRSGSAKLWSIEDALRKLYYDFSVGLRR